MKFEVLIQSNCVAGVTAYVVADVPDSYKGNERHWPKAAIFPVSLRYDEEIQRRRAVEYCNYLNSVSRVLPPIGQTQSS